MRGGRAQGSMSSTTTPTPRLAYADTRLGQMHLRIWPGPPDATAPAVVCLHPVPYSGRYYDHFAGLLSLRVSVIAPDLAGYGGSVALEKPASIAEHAAAVADALQDQGVARFVPLGFHTGSAVAAELALARPRRVPKLICITYPLLTAEDRKEQLASLGKAPQLGEQVESLRRRWRFTVNNRAAGVPLDSAFINFVEELRAGDRGWFGFQSMFEYPSEERLVKVKQRALVVNVDSSLKAATLVAAELLPNVSYVEFMQMNRGIFELHGPQLAATVSAFVEGVDED